MKKVIAFIASTAALGFGAAYAAAPDALVRAAEGCCAALAACCLGGAGCC